MEVRDDDGGSGGGGGGASIAAAAAAAADPPRGGRRPSFASPLHGPAVVVLRPGGGRGACWGPLPPTRCPACTATAIATATPTAPVTALCCPPRRVAIRLLRRYMRVGPSGCFPRLPSRLSQRPPTTPYHLSHHLSHPPSSATLTTPAFP